MRSIYAERSLDLSDEARFFYQERSPYTGNRKVLTIPKPNPRTGMVTTVWPVGGALIRLPSFAAADVCARLMTRAGFAVDTRGYRGMYQFFPAVYSLGVGVAGLLMLAAAIGRFGNRERALSATATVWLASPVAYYLTIEPLMSHSLSVGLACGLIAISWQLPRTRAVPHFTLLGFICALLAITRYQDAAYFLVPITLVYRYSFRECVAIAAGAAPVIAIQLAVNLAWYGSPWTTGYASVVVPDWLAGGVWRHLFSPLQGMFTTHPIQLLGMIGLAWMYPIHKRLTVVLGLIFVLQVYAVAALASPGMSFGNRTLTSLTPAFVLGWERLSARFPHLQPVGLALVCANVILMGLYCLRIVVDPSAI